MTAAVLLDIDGTIVARDGSIAPELVAALARLRDGGAVVACATARTRPSARIRLGPLAWMADEGVFQNGSLVVAGGRVAHAFTMPAATVRSAVAAATAADPAVVIAIHHATRAPAFSAGLTDELLAAWGYRADEVRAIADGVREPAIKVGMWMPGEAPGSIAAVHAAVDAAVGTEATVYQADEGRFVFMTPPGVDKAHGARAWFAARALSPRAAIAAGDDRTDAPLLALCGRSIAIRGGHPEALAAAGEAVEPPPHAGLAHALSARACP